MGLEQGLGIIVFFALGAIVGYAAEFIPRLLIKSKKTAEKMMPFESGEDPVGTSRVRFRIQYYIFAVAFVTFDVVAAIAIPWAVGWNLIVWTPLLVLFGSMLLVIGYYAAKGELEWL
jgi:NADH:ubiquinone oxidoreductase subunit 3 (subunit A)